MLNDKYNRSNQLFPGEVGYEYATDPIYENQDTGMFDALSEEGQRRSSRMKFQKTAEEERDLRETVNARLVQLVEHKRKAGSNKKPDGTETNFNEFERYWAQRLDVLGITAVQAFNDSQVMKKVTEGLSSDKEIDYVASLIVNEEEKAKRNGNLGYMAFDLTTMLPSYGASFLVPGGLAKGVGTATAKSASKGLMRAGMKQATANAIGKTTGIATRIGAHTAMQPKIFGGALADRTGTEIHPVEINGETQFVVKDGEDIANALPKAFADAYIETASEYLGAGLGKLPVWNNMKTAIVSKFASATGVSLAAPRVRKMITEKIAKVGYDGILEEMIEERASELASGATGLSDNFGVIEQLITPEHREQALLQLGAELISFSVLPGTIQAGMIPLENSKYRDLVQDTKNTQKLLQDQRSKRHVAETEGVKLAQQVAFKAKYNEEWANKWATENPEKAQELVKGASRSAWEKAGLHGNFGGRPFNSKERQQFSDWIKNEPPQSQPEPATEPATEPIESPLVVPPEAVPPEAVPPEAVPPEAGISVPPEPVQPLVQTPQSVPDQPIPSVPSVPDPAGPLEFDDPPDLKLASRIVERLSIGESFDGKKFFEDADEAWGGTRAQGKYGPSDAYDALETGVNRYISTRSEEELPSNPKSVGEVLRGVEFLEKLLERIPSQTNRSGEKQSYQQFSTPPAYAYIASWLANIDKNDIVLEPSAGTGGIAVHAKRTGARVFGNEISERRAALLKSLGLANVFKEDAELAHHTLPGRMKQKPTVVIMNPPFSRAGHRLGNRKRIGTDLKHVDSALKALADGGRLVAIVGAPRQEGQETSIFLNWSRQIEKQYDLKAYALPHRNIYKGYGTTFPTRLLVIDKIAPSGKPVAGSSYTNTLDLIEGLKDVANDRIRTSVPESSEGTERTDGGESVPVGANNVGTGERNPSGTDSKPPRGDSGDAPSPNVEPAGKPQSIVVRKPKPEGHSSPTENVIPESGGNVSDKPGAGSTGITGGGERGGSKREELEQPVKVESAKKSRSQQLTTSTFEPYQPNVSIPNSKKHPASLVESTAMSAVDAPKIDGLNLIHLPAKTISSGALSDIQLERVAYAQAAFQKTIGKNEQGIEVTRGFMVGDGTGSGKGRTAAGVILNNWPTNKKAVWFTKKSLFKQAQLDWKDIGGQDGVMFKHETTASGFPVDHGDGIMMTSYGALAKDLSDQAKKEGKTISRVDQIVDWVGKDFDGVIVFDESHKMANAIVAGRGKDPTKTGTNGLDLQDKLPKAKILYMSATSATEIHNLGYAERLGLWGEKTAFSNVNDFINSIQDQGLAAMEIVAQDMKALGAYLSSSISLNDGTKEGTVEFRKLEHTFDETDTSRWDKISEGWGIIIDNIQEALKLTDRDKKKEKNAMGQLWGLQQRVSNSVLTSMALPSLFADMDKQLAAGHSIAIQFTTTGDANVKKVLANKTNDQTFDDLDFSPLQAIISYLRNAFPVYQYVEVMDPNNPDKTTWVVARHKSGPKKGEPIENPEAVAMRERLIKQIQSIYLPSSPLDEILEKYGVDNVAEVTGRQHRYIRQIDPQTGEFRRIKETRGMAAREADIKAFNDDKKRIIVFSSAGGTGASYHASLGIKNQRKRIHYLLDPGWVAVDAIQGLGRTHRSNQKQAPEYVLVHTNVLGQKRFISTIARRLLQMNALGKGQRDAGASGNENSELFSAADNLESSEAKEAWDVLLRDIISGEAEGWSIDYFESQTYLKLRNADNTIKTEKSRPTIKQFMNRLLVMKFATQNSLYEQFDRRLVDQIQYAIESGTLDKGVENLKADKVEKISESVVYTHEESGAKTTYVHLNAQTKNQPFPFDQARKSANNFYQSHDGKVFSAEPTDARTARGEKQYRLRNPLGKTHYVEARGIDSERIATRIPEGKARDLWDEQQKTLSQYSKQNVHLLVGTLLPIWNKLPAARASVKRTVTDDGEHFLGRMIPHKQIGDVLKVLGVKSKDSRPATADEAIEHLGNGGTVRLGNQWTISNRRVQNEMRIELIGPDFNHETYMNQIGVFEETIASKPRNFIPTGEKGIPTIARLIKDYGISDLVGGNDYNVIDHSIGKPSVKKSSLTSKQKQISLGNNPIPVETEATQDYKRVVSHHDIIKTAEFIFDVKIQFGRRIKRKVAGFFDRKTHLIALNKQQEGNVRTAMHEIGHAADTRTDGTKKLPRKLQTELKQLAKRLRPEGLPTSREGWSIFIELFLFDGHDIAKANAPEFYDYFHDEWMIENPWYARNFKIIESMVDQWQKQGTDARVEGSIVFGGRGSKPLLPMPEYVKHKLFSTRGGQEKGFVHRFYETFKDEGTVLSQFTKDAKRKGFQSKKGNEPYQLMMALTQAGPTYAHHALNRGVFNISSDLNPRSPSMADVFLEIENKEYKTFVRWLVSRHAKEVWSHGKNPGIAKGDAERFFEKHKNPRFERAAVKYKQFHDALIDLLANSKVIDKRAAKRIKDAWMTYVPLARERSDVVGPQGYRRKLVNLGTELHGRTGSGLRVIDPIQVTFERTVRYYTRAMQQQVIQRMIEAATKTDNMANWIVEVPPGMKGITFTADRAWPTIRNTLIESGAIPEELIPDNVDEILADDLLTIWKPDYQYIGDKPIARVIVNGKPKMFMFDPDLFKAINGMNFYQLPRLLDMTAGFATRTVRLGATGINFAFALKNMIRDYLTYLVQSKHAVKKGRTFKGLVEPMTMVGSYVTSNVKQLLGDKPDEMIDLWQSFGGELGTPIGLDRKRIKKSIDDAIANNTTRRFYNIARHPLDALAKIVNVSEVGPRLAEFKAVLESHGWDRNRIQHEGIPPRYIVIEAVNASHDVTVNFKRLGTLGKKINQYIPFWNSKYEGLDKFVRTWIDNPKKATSKAVIYSLGLASATAAWWWTVKDDDWYKDAEDWLKYGFWTITNDKGEPIVRIPRHHDWNFFVAVPTQALLDTINEQDPENLTSSAKYVGGNISMGLDDMPALIKPSVEVGMNYDTFREQPIFSELYNPVEARHEATAWNSELSKAIGRYLGVSPAKLEFWLSAQTGGLSNNVMETADTIYNGEFENASDIPILNTFMFEKNYSKSFNEFYNEFDRIKRKRNSAEKDGEIPRELENRYQLLLQYSSISAEIRNEYKTITNRQERFNLEKFNLGMIREALGDEPLESRPSLLSADVNELPANLQTIRANALWKQTGGLTIFAQRRIWWLNQQK